MLHLGRPCSSNNTDNVVAKLLDKTLIQVKGKPVEDIGSLMKSDGAVIGSPKAFDTEDNEVCGTRDSNKIACVTIGMLVQPRSKLIFNALEDF